MSSAKTNIHESSLLNIVDQLSFYRAYHFNPINVVIHLFCIPMIVATSFMLAMSVNLYKFTPFIPSEYSTYVNLSSLATLFYLSYYMVLDNMGYFFILPFILLNFYGPKIYDVLGEKDAYISLLTVFGASWIAQFIGHGVYEKRAPALLDNLLQPLVLAPYFVGYEIAFFFGFKKDLQKQMNNRAGLLLRDFRATHKKT